MKKFFTLIIAALFSISLQAQTPLTEAVDFTATDHEGNEINLFEILDGGQYVLIEEEEDYTYIWIIAGVSAGVLVIAAVVVTIVLVNKKKKKALPQISEDEGTLNE